jgi:hypothetical protein
MEFHIIFHMLLIKLYSCQYPHTKNEIMKIIFLRITNLQLSPKFRCRVLQEEAVDLLDNVRQVRLSYWVIRLLSRWVVKARGH